MTSELTSAPRSLCAALLLLGGCSATTTEEGLSVDVQVGGHSAPAALEGAWIGLRSVELVPCAVAWRPVDLLLGRPARADHSLDTPTAALFSSSTELTGAGAHATVQPPPGDYCYARFTVEPQDEGQTHEQASVSAELEGTLVTTDRVAWLDQPITLSLSKAQPTAVLRLDFDLSGWADAAAAGPDALFETAREQVSLTQD